VDADLLCVCVCVCVPFCVAHAQGDCAALDLVLQCGGLSSLETLVSFYGDEWTPFLAPTMAAMGSYQVPLCFPSSAHIRSRGLPGTRRAVEGNAKG